MELVRNEKLNGIELHITKKDNTLETLNTIRTLGWHWSQRKGHFYHTFDEALIASTKAAFPILDKKSKPSKSKAPTKAEKPAAPSKSKAKASSTKKPAASKSKSSKKTVTVSPAVTDDIPFSIEKAGFKADPTIGVDELKVWKAAVLHSIEELLDNAIASLATAQ